MRLPILSWTALLVILAAMSGDLTGQAPPANQGEDEAQVLGRGPLHEAFAAPTTTQARSAPVIAKQPPDPIPEQPPEQQPEGNNVQWLAGYWAWDEDGEDFIWISGCWRDIPPNRTWMPGYWAQVSGGWQWVAGYWTEANQAEVQYLPEPPATVDMGPSAPAPSADSIYVPGVWVYVQTAYRWRPGYWMRCHPDWVWTPAYYCWTPGGYVFVDGHYDYLFQRRGLLFAPVRFQRQYWAQANWYFRPRYTVYQPALLASLFVRPDRGRYYFGDYYAAQYERRGFVPWISYQPYRGGVDPLYAYSRWRHRDDPRWETQLRTTYEQRRSGEVPRPAHNLTQQVKQAQEIQNNPKVKVNNTQDLTVLVALNQLEKDKTQVKLRAVPKEEQTQFTQVQKELRAARQERQKVEGQLRAQPDEGKKAAPKTAKIELPKTLAAAKGKAVQPPPPPESSKEQPEPKAEPKVDPKVEPKVQPKVDPKADPKIDPKVEPKTQPKVDPKSEPKTQPKVDPKVDPKVEPKTQPKVDPKVDPTPKQPKTQPKADPKVEPKVDPKVQPKVEPRPEPKSPPKVDPTPKQPKAEPDMPVPNPKTPPAPRPQPKQPAVDPEPAPRPDPKPAPKLPVPDPTPRPQPPKAAPPPKADPPPKAEPRPQPKAPPDRPKGRDKDGKDA